MAEDIGIDLGTATFLIYTKNRGLILKEPSVIAMNRDSRQVRAVGDDAYRMIGRTPEGIVAVRPVRDGVISDKVLTEKMIGMFLQKANIGGGGFLGLRGGVKMMIGVPSNISDVEKRAVINAAMQNNARRAYLIEEPLAAALGAGLKITDPIGSMIVDIGGGSTDIAVISMGGIVVSESMRVAGDEFDESIMRYLRRRHNVLIGERTAEEIKIHVGAAMIHDESESVAAEVRGRDLTDGLPKTIAVDTIDVIEALSDPLTKIVEATRRVLEMTPPELVSDIMDRGIIMTGGGSLLKNFDELLRQTTGIPVAVAENAVEAVAIGTGMALDMVGELGDSLVSSDMYIRR
ncbi:MULTISPECIES: rod shape-determining protein [Deinococcus]|uniref:Cell shape-determining protein MreB n=1 Tax=Deinococcus cavernae TaxID=2320857 RepID=A0A418V4P5_9DEIO|nr:MULTISPECIES: rod shape-determining protein [Deinococcus]RJF71005.1 rod shape-determining protein [Deinococcus cavernae]